MEFERKDRYNVADLVEIVRILRAPGGCPWDAEQTHQSIRNNLIEETYEVADAIDREDAALLCEELGDLLLQVVMHTRMETELGGFDFDDVCDGICQKLIYRHPHVFGQVAVGSSDEVLQNWEALKNTEKGRETAAQRLDSVPPSLPALMRAGKVQKRAAAFGFAYETVQDALADLRSELEELEQAVEDGQGMQEELGDLLFSAVNVARFVGADAEEALTASTDKFARRVKAVEAMAGDENLAGLDARQLDVLWKQAKAEEKQP
ncbi:MAG: nucleoside triphosphate pyrophosphohydrolase [Ruminococcaceae bacterium]|nr:nucleoside triphosphate pyrophosphohydrolase [Oscillospiraceae bacterium]